MNTPHDPTRIPEPTENTGAAHADGSTDIPGDPSYREALCAPADDHAAADRDVVLSRIIDGRATGAEWVAFRGWSQTDASVWSDLQHMQRDHERLVHAVDDCLAGIDRVGISPFDSNTGVHSNNGVTRASGGWALGRFSGWAAAACIALAWIGLGGAQFGDQFGSIDSDQGGSSNATLNPVADANPRSADMMGDDVWNSNPARALEYYLASGQQNGHVVGELPDRPLVQTRRLPDGQVEMLWVRQILERSVVPETFRTTRDEFGNKIAVPVQIQNASHTLPPT